jgi:adenylate kinase
MIRILFVTCPPEEAGKIAGHLLSQRVCACVSTVPGVESRYWWEGRLETTTESLLIIKCAAELVETVIAKVREVHPYRVPEIIVLPVEGGNPDYLAWVRGDPRVGGERMQGLPPFAERAAPARPAARSVPAAAAAETTTAGAPRTGLPPIEAAVLERAGRLKIVLLGPPGVGKGTQARILAKRYGIRHISTGDMFLKAIRSGSQLGQEISQYTNTGRLVPDRTTNILIQRELAGSSEKGYVLNGFPRTLAQAEALAQAERIDFAFYINAPQEVLIARLTSRFYCDCGESFGPERAPAVKGLCDGCGGMLYQREDDKPRNVLTRIEEYNSKTRELLRFYRDLLHPVDGSLSPVEVTRQICRQLER